MNLDKKTIEEGNKKIAIYLGGEVAAAYENHTTGVNFYRIQGAWVSEWRKSGYKVGGVQDKMMLEMCEFHKSWDWLMPVIKKIKSEPFKERRGEKRWAHYVLVDAGLLRVDISLAYKGCIDYIDVKLKETK